MTDKPHTPDTQTVKAVYADFGKGPSPYRRKNEFDRWYAAEIAAAEQRGAVKALQDAAKDWRWSAWADTPKNPIAAANYVGDWISDRANQMEGDDD